MYPKKWIELRPGNGDPTLFFVWKRSASEALVLSFVQNDDKDWEANALVEHIAVEGACECIFLDGQACVGDVQYTGHEAATDLLFKDGSKGVWEYLNNKAKDWDWSDPDQFK